LRIIPKDKHDLESVENLKLASDDIVLNSIDELFEWVQDYNWPVAKGIIERLTKLNELLVEPIRKILKTNDSIWKYWVLVKVLPFTNDKLVMLLNSDLQQLSKNPSHDDKLEKIDLLASELLQAKIGS
jgi:hypothetical protein